MDSKEIVPSGSIIQTMEPPDLDRHTEVLNGVQEQIRFADAKAGFVAGLNILLLGFVFSTFDKFPSALNGNSAQTKVLCWIAIGFIIPYVLATLISFLLVIWAVISRFGEMSPRCKIFFGHITTHYGRDYGRYVHDLEQMTHKEWACEIGTQILVNSHIAHTKHRLVCWSALSTVAAFAIWVIGMATITTVYFIR